VEDGLVEKQQRTQGLILRRRCHMALHGQVGQKRIDFRTPHLGGMAFLMKQHKTLRPIDIGIFSTDGVMLRVQDVPHLVEQLLGSLFLWHTRSNLLALYTDGRRDYTARVRVAKCLINPEWTPYRGYYNGKTSC
jgi:hypothetical protein